MSDPPAASPAAPIPPTPPAQGPQPGAPPAPDKPDPKAPGPEGTAPAETETTAGPEDLSVKPGSDQAKAATSRYGQGSRRGEYRREAQGWNIDGDFVGGDKETVTGDKNVYNFAGERDLRPSELPSRLTHLIKDAFVPPPCLAEVQAAYEKRRVVVLRGADGCGKLGLAIHLLLESCTGPLFRVDPSADLARLRQQIETGDAWNKRISPEAGLLLDHPVDSAHLDGSALQGLEEALDQAASRMILTVGPRVIVSDELHDYVVDVPAAPDLEKIVEGHLKFHNGPEVKARIFARIDIRQFLREELRSAASCQSAAELATFLAAKVRKPEDADSIDVVAIRDEWSQHGAEAFDKWFGDLKETQSRCYAVALAVLDGLPYDTVAKAARALYRRFDTHPYAVMVSSSDPPPDGQRPFLRSRQDWLHQLKAKIETRNIKGLYGQSRAETVSYNNPRFRKKTIERAWSDYQAQDALLGWLGEIAQDNSEQVRIRAGNALGLLVLQSFDHVSLNVLQPWAAGPVHQREAVAYALLTVAADEPPLHQNLKKLVSGWYADTGRPLAQATAARAYGLVRGAIDRDEAFRALAKLATVDDIRVAIAVGDAVADLLEDGPDDFACRVLATLASSLDDRRISTTVQLVFLIVADALLATVHNEGRAQETSWPFLLRLATGQPQARAALVRLWKYVLNGAQFVDEAAQVMTAWANATESDPEMREAFLRLIRAVAAGDNRTWLIFARYVALWTSEDNFSPIPQTSAAVQAILDAERKPR